MFEVKIGITPDLGSRHQVQLVARRHVLDDARHVSDSHSAKRVGAMASVVEDQPLLGVDGV